MKKNLLLLTSFLLLAGTFSSCKKECPVDEPSKTELLTAHEWQGVDGMEYRNGTLVNTRDMSGFIFLFAVNKDLFVYENGTLDEYYHWEYIKGSPDIIHLEEVNTAPSPITHHFFFLNDTQTRVPQTYDFKVEKLNETKLTFYMEITDGSGNTTKFVYHFKK